jgi:hypothetical protein
MYLQYARGEAAAWSLGVRYARDFIAGALLSHVTTWPHHGRLGVPADLDGRALCAVLPRLIDDHGEFGLLVAGALPRLLVLPVVRAPEPIALCYGPWPGIETWEREVEGCLPPGMTLLCTRWNCMPWPVPAALAPKLIAERSR